jgi:deazaflavin-dependent oxidoreductase (nitroreductase family)
VGPGPGAGNGPAWEPELVASGRVARLVTTGRRTGLPRPVVVGFVEEADGSILVAATDDVTAWGLNLLDDPLCTVEFGDRRFTAVAEPLDGADHARAISGLILRYGTPSEGLGRGPSFRLRPIGD